MSSGRGSDMEVADEATFHEEIEPQADTSLRRIENVVNLIALLLLGLMPLLEMITRTIFSAGIEDSSLFIQHFVLLVGFLGGMLASREDAHLSVGTVTVIRNERVRIALNWVSHSIAIVFTAAFFVSSLEWWFTAFDQSRIAFIPVRVFAIIVPIAYLVMTIRIAGNLPSGRGRVPAIAIAVLVGLLLSSGSLINMVYFYSLDPDPRIFALEASWQSMINVVAVPLIVILIASAFVGTPLFVVLTGLAYLLFARDFGVFLSVIPNTGYAKLITNTIPAIPMFTFVGYVLSESKAGERLFRLFRAFLGWMPGGMVVASILVSVFFATFTGASGVVILALGGLLYTILHTRGKLSEAFTVGLLTGVGDIGLLFLPSLVLIIYGTTAQINVLDMFRGGLLPGLMTVLVFCVMGIIVSVRKGESRQRFDAREALAALLDSIWEILLPVVIIGFYFGGLTSLIETGAVAVVYVVVIESMVHRELKFRDLTRAGVKSAVIMGGILIIIAGASALSEYIVFSRLPFVLIEWVQANIGSRLAFLLLLNLALLVAGCFMDIFSALVVIVPLILPLGEIFSVHPVHLGVIFVANMALGFMTPPVGLELFLASYRFGLPLTRIYRYIVPFFLLQLAAVLLITYVPWLSLALVGG